MKALAIFAACAFPATALLLYLDRDDKGVAELPERELPADGVVLLSGADLADAYGQSPFSGAVRRLDGFELRVVEEGYFKLYLRIERLGRADGEPRLEEVRAAIFDPPKEGKPNLRMTLRAPFVSGDPRELLNAKEDAPRVVTLDGGVEAFDAAGQPLAQVARLTLDLRAKTATSDVPVLLRLPEREAEVRAQGLDADLGMRKARLKGPVVASAGGPAGTTTLRAKNVATVEEAEDGSEVKISFEGEAQVEHAGGRATCPRIDVVLARAEGKMNLLRATLSGGVRLDIAPGSGLGLETIDMRELEVTGEEEVTCTGPVHAVWRGRLPGLALGDRTVTVDAKGAWLRLARAEDGRLVLDEANSDGFLAADVDGAGSLAGRVGRYKREGNTFSVEEQVEARTPEMHLVADHLLVEAPEKDAYDVRIDGAAKRLVYSTEAGHGPLGAYRQVRLESKGAIRFHARGERISCSAEDHVVATTDAASYISGDALTLEMEKGKLLAFRAGGSVVAADPTRGAKLLGDLLSHEGGATVIEGRPASIALDGGRTVRAPRITRREDGTFEATGGVEAEAPLAAEDARCWRLICADVRGVLMPSGKPASVEAHGAVRATGPDGEEATGEALSYDGATGVATLVGEPARIRRGSELAMAAPKGLTLRIEEGRVAEGSSLGPSTIDYRPVLPEGAKPDGFRRWLAVLQGPARFLGERVVVAKGAKLTGFDEADREALVAEAQHVEILLDVEQKTARVREIAGSKGVRVESRGKNPATVTAERLSCVAGAREVHVAGSAQVVAEGWPREVRFRELLFTLTREGIDLKRASEIEVR